jgi:cysteine synthase A
MNRIYTSIEQLIGKTPLVQLCRLEQQEEICASVFAKLEYFNPAGSAKDRVAIAMLDDAEEKGLLFPDSTIIEPTSGNTGLGLACVCAVRGYRTIIVMPDNMSEERKKLMRAYGAELVLTPGAEGMKAAIQKAKALAATIPHSFIPSQFDNPACVLAHYRSTGPEIWNDTAGMVDIFVAGVGTGGTLTGVGRYLKENNPNIRIVAVEPAASPLLSGGAAAPHGLQGIGANFIPSILDTSIYDEIIPVTEEHAYLAARTLGKTEGICAGISSGAALHAALQLARQEENRGKRIVVLLPDTGDRYLSTPLFSDSSPV